MKKILLSLTILASTFSIGQSLSWTTQNTNFPATQDYFVSQIHALDNNTAWAIPRGVSSAPVAYPKYVTVTNDAGNTWTSKTVSAPSGALLSMVFGIDANTAFVVTAPSASGAANNGVYKTTDAGTTWTKKTSATYNNAASFANIIHFWDANNGFTIGDPINGKYEAYKTTDGGETWTVLSTAPSTSDDNEFGYNGGIEVNGEHVWLTSSTGVVWHSGDRGTTWNKFFTPIMDFGGVITEGSFGHLSFSSPSYGLVIGSDEMLFYTEDGGTNWEVMETTGFYNGDIQWVPGTEKTYISTSTDFNNLNLGYGSSISYDGGQTWEVIDMEVQRGTIGAFSPDAVWAGQFQTTLEGGGILKLDGSLFNNDIQTSKIDLKVVAQNNTLNLYSNKEIKSATIVDMKGGVVSTFKGKNQNISNLPKGVYIVKVQYDNGSFGTMKFVK